MTTHGLTRVGIRVVHGESHLRHIAVDLSTQHHPSIRTKIARCHNKIGWRFYAEHTLPDLLGGGDIRQSRTIDGIAAGLNREELLRSIPSGDPDHDGRMGRHASIGRFSLRVAERGPSRFRSAFKRSNPPHYAQG